MSEAAVVPVPVAPARTVVQHPFRRLLRNPLGVASLIMLAAILMVAILAPWIAPFDPNATRVEYTNAPPFTTEYLLGGDSAGRDVLSRLIWAARGTLAASATVLVVSVTVGATAGLLAGYYAGPLQSATNWIFDVLLALPGVVLLIALYTVIGPNILLAMAIYGFMVAPIFYRLTRAVVSAVRNELYIDAAKVSGLTDSRILFRHVLRAVRSPIIIQSSFILGAAVGIQAALEFLGLGSPSEPSWGGMLDFAFRNIYVAPMGVLWPSIAVTVTVLAFVLLGNALRDALDPSSKLLVLDPRRAIAARGAADAQAAPVEPTAGTVLSIRGLRVAYPVSRDDHHEVVRGVDLEVRRGEIVGLVGESGSGKSQTAFSVLGVLPKNALILGGSVTFDGTEILQRNSALRAVRGTKIAYIPQEPMTNLDPTMTIGTQMRHWLRSIKKTSRSAADQRITELLRRVGIADAEEVMRKYPHEISGGMAQRVLIAGAVAGDPELIIADEPTTALDVTVQAGVLDLIRELRDEGDLAVILVTHNLGVVSDICDRVAVMKEGRIVEDAPTIAFFAGPQAEYSRELLRAASQLE
ncbi:dipeptide/oligopeptide/nickel ABC transporter permease/ATP-binding protein [Microbacterium sp. HD4P20]|uniref:dipeptide/oligopeptide/nickel ABC transporter permease/ATP-binding protein n=1 Tax=Microbacterium sp. HD4P20 TaxID=2864874 RepID=UPI001C63F444|nr:dipeptide/oligopeptide/nickel ABC transporter permease/ATP-binding protein [Microbacterium sp. HD4P20]MCP2636009.1 dipeptide/oligopeptide/nickel ABC transporter permease/ATP-binding protein [Microbacterium sp. HD4P20]